MSSVNNASKAATSSVSSAREPSWDEWEQVATKNPVAPEVGLMGGKVVVIKPNPSETLSAKDVKATNMISLANVNSSLAERFGGAVGQCVFKQVFQDKIANARPISSEEIRCAGRLGKVLKVALQELQESKNKGELGKEGVQALFTTAFSQFLLVEDDESVEEEKKFQAMLDMAPVDIPLSKKDKAPPEKNKLPLEILVPGRLAMIQSILEEEKGDLDQALKTLEARLSATTRIQEGQQGVAAGLHDAVHSASVTPPEIPALPAKKFIPGITKEIISRLGWAVMEDKPKETREALADLKAKLAPQKEEDTIEGEYCLTKEDEKWLTEALRWACKTGKAEVIKAFLKGLSELGPPLSPASIMSLAEAKDENGKSVLHMALRNGKADTAKAYLQTLPSLEKYLSTDQMVSLLKAEDHKKIPGFHIALANGHAQTVEAYLKALQTAGKIARTEGKPFTADQIINLVEAKNSKGYSGFNIACYNGHTWAVKAYLNALPLLRTNFNLSAENLERLARGMDGEEIDGINKRIPALSRALQKGRTGTVNVYLQALFDFKDKGILDDAQIKRLAESKDAFDNLGISIAREAGHKETVKACSKHLIELGFTPEQVKDLCDPSWLKNLFTPRKW